MRPVYALAGSWGTLPQKETEWSERGGRVMKKAILDVVGLVV